MTKPVKLSKSLFLQMAEEERSKTKDNPQEVEVKIHHLKHPTHSQRFKCAQCKKEFLDNCRLNVHIRDAHIIDSITGESFQCAFCDEKFFQLQLLKDHKKNIHKLVKNRCDICDKDFPFQAQLIIHKRKVHKINYKCDFCDMDFPTKDKRESHIKSKHNEEFQKAMIISAKKIACSFCEDRFDTMTEKEVHFHKVHPHVNTTDEDGRDLYLGKIKIPLYQPENSSSTKDSTTSTTSSNASVSKSKPMPLSVKRRKMAQSSEDGAQLEQQNHNLNKLDKEVDKANKEKELKLTVDLADILETKLTRQSEMEFLRKRRERDGQRLLQLQMEVDDIELEEQEMRKELGKLRSDHVNSEARQEALLDETDNIEEIDLNSATEIVDEDTDNAEELNSELELKCDQLDSDDYTPSAS